MILVIGDLERWVRSGRTLPDEDDIRFVSFDRVDPAMMRDLAPILVLSPLREEGFDAVDVAQMLADAGYQGRFRAVTMPLPDADLIREEVAAAAPGLDFDLIILDSRLN